MVNRYENNKVFSFTASSPKAHVIPRKGRITIEALISFLLRMKVWQHYTVAMAAVVATTTII